MEQITKYFMAEKYESVLFILTGVVSILTAIYFLMLVKKPFYQGMAYPLIAVAIIQITVGGTVYRRSPEDILRVHGMLTTDKSRLQLEEIPRMNVVMHNFQLYRKVEMILLVVGILLYFSFPILLFWKGLGLGLIIQSGFMLILDYFAETRGKVYLEFLGSLI